MGLLPSLGFGFFNDDYVGLEKLGSIPPSSLASLVFLENFQFFRPLGIITFRCYLAITGANPVLMHGLHLAVFIVAAWLAGVLAGRLFGPAARPWGAALALAYPGRLETSVWLSATFDLYALTLGTAALVVAAGNWRHPWRSALFLGLLSSAAVLYKESALVLPLVVGSWQALGVFRGRGRLVNLVRLGSVVMGSGAAFAARFPALGGVGGYEGIGPEAWWTGVMGLPELALRLVFWPGNPYYPLSGLLNLAVAAVTAGLLVIWLGRRGTKRWALGAGGMLAVLGLLPVLGYVDPARATYLQSRYLSLAALGVVVAMVQGALASPRLFGPLLVAVWTAATALNLQPWYEARERRDALLGAVEEATRPHGQHVVWVGGELDTWRGAQQMGGRIPLAIHLAFPERQIRVVSAYDQRRRGELPCPSPSEHGATLQTFYLADHRPWLRRGVPPTHECPPPGTQ